MQRSLRLMAFVPVVLLLVGPSASAVASPAQSCSPVQTILADMKVPAATAPATGTISASLVEALGINLPGSSPMPRAGCSTRYGQCKFYPDWDGCYCCILCDGNCYCTGTCPAGGC